jgi:hypothetical protein
MKRLRFLALVALGASCHLDALFKSPGAGGSPAGTVTARLTFISQPSQATAGQAIAPVEVAVVDSAGQRLTAFTGSIAITLASSSGATLSGTQTVVAAGGVATFSDLTIDRAGQYALRASASGAAPATSTPIDVVAPPPPPPGVTHLGYARQPLQTNEAGAVMSPVMVAALDASGNVVAGFGNRISIALGANPGGGTLSGTVSVAAVQGIATFSDLSIDNVGSGYTLRAATPGLTPVGSASFDVAPAPPPPGGAAYLRFTDQPQIMQAGQAMPAVRVTIYDASDNQVRTFTGNVTITLGSNPAAGTLTTASPTIDMDLGLGGVVQWTDLTIDRPGNGYTLRATSPGLRSATSDPFDITSDPPPPLNGATGLAFYQEPTTTRANELIVPPIRVGVQGSGGTIVPDYAGAIWISLDANPGGATLSGTRRVYPVNGFATFSDLRIDKPGSGYTLRATAWPLNYKRSVPFDVTPP